MEPNHVELVWAVRRITDVQAKYIAMFYGEDVLRALRRQEADHEGHSHHRLSGYDPRTPAPRLVVGW
jgi:hypothetical protein